MEDETREAPKARPEQRLALFTLCHLRGWTQGDLAKAMGMKASQMSVYTLGERAVPRAVFEKAALAADFPPYLLDPLLAELRSLHAGAKGLSRPGRILSNEAAMELIALVQRASNVILQPAGTRRRVEAAPSAERDRAEASRLWGILQACTAEDRRMLIEELEEFQTWALVERVARESIEAAPNHPEEALNLAELALAIAETVPGDVAWRSRLQGYAWAHVGNARRVSNDLPGADQALEQAWQLWEAGAAGDPGLLERAWLPWLDGALRKAQRRFPEALQRLEAALAAVPGELRGKILLTKSRIHEALGQPELSTATLHEAAPWIDAQKEPRLALYLRFNLLTDLCQLERFEEANLKLPKIRELAQRLGEELDLARVAWLEGKIAAGMKRTAEAEAAFKEAQQVFSRRKLTYDYALVSLDLAALWLGQNRTADVKALAEEMLAIFRAQKVGREALAALQMFCDAARREAATVELARRVHAEVERAWRWGSPRDRPARPRLVDNK